MIYDPNFQYNTQAESEGYGIRYAASAKSLLTGSLTARLGEDTPAFDYAVFYYYNPDRIVQSKSINHLGGFDQEYLAYNFTGQPIKCKHIHSAAGQPTQMEQYAYTYDHAERLLTTTHQLNGNSPITLADRVYDELGLTYQGNQLLQVGDEYIMQIQN